MCRTMKGVPNMQAMGSALLVAMAVVLCMRQFRKRRRWQNSHQGGGSSGNLAASRRHGSLGNFASVSALTAAHHSPG